jgi:2-dehydro-3-deoxygluconokinase
MTYDVATVGESMVMVTPTLPQPLVDATELRLEVGGAESNLALHLSGLGHRVSWTSRLGADPLGRRVNRAISAGGVDTSSVVFDPLGRTGIYFKDPHPTGTRVHYYRHDSAAAGMGPELLSSIPIASSRVVHLSGITPSLSPSCAELVDAVIAEAHRAGVLVSFDVNYRSALWPVRTASRVLERIVAECDIVFVGRDEAEVLWGTATPEQTRSRLAAPLRLVVKDADIGATEFRGATSTFVPALPVEVVEAVGAGDAFAAGYLSAFLRGRSSLDCLQLGHDLAARVLVAMADFTPSDFTPSDISREHE